MSRAMTITDQAALFKKAETQGLELAKVLADCGMTFNDLIYEKSFKRKWGGSQPRRLTSFEKPKNGVPLVSFFSGCGGLDLGFETAGFEHIAAIEIKELFCKTLRQNRPDWNIIGPPTSSGDVAETEELKSILGRLIPKNFEGVFIGGPPCQPFSIAANQRFSKNGENFKRVGFGHEKNGSLLFNYIELVCLFKPAVFLIENVPGLRDLDGGAQLDEAYRKLEANGYSIEAPTILNAADYEVPQYRERLFVVGTRLSKTFTPPSPSKNIYGAGSVLTNVDDGLENTETRCHKLDSVMRYSKLDYGERDQLGRVDRLNPCNPSKTVIAGGSGGGGRSHLHPEIPRTLSVRECARLQTFPDDYNFVGSTARQFTQVGNAVPPVLASQLAASISHSLFKK